MEARERRPQGKTERKSPVDIDKEDLKKAFDLSHFDINAILRGAELTLVGGEFDGFCPHRGLGIDSLQPTELSRTQPCLQVTTTNKPYMLSQQALPYACSFTSRFVLDWPRDISSYSHARAYTCFLLDHWSQGGPVVHISHHQPRFRYVG